MLHMIRKPQSFSSVTGATFVVGVFVAVLLSLAAEKPAFAQAQQFGDRGQLVITGENLFGFSTERFGQDTSPNREVSTTFNQFGFLYKGFKSEGIRTAHGPWVGAHYFVIPNLSIGGTVGFQTVGGSGTVTTNGTTIEQEGGSQFAFMFLPKVGYALMLNNLLGFWFRGGPGLMLANSTSAANSNNTDSASFWFLSVDALFVITPAQYIGFYAGPQANLSFAGSVSETTNNTTVSQDASYRSFSIDAGIFGYFDL
jgi:hypothetical protein